MFCFWFSALFLIPQTAVRGSFVSQDISAAPCYSYYSYSYSYCYICCFASRLLLQLQLLKVAATVAAANLLAWRGVACSKFP
jgi:hypothetical protein